VSLGAVRAQLAERSQAFSATARNPSLLRAQLAFGATWTSEWAFTVAIGVVAFRDGGAEAVGIVGFARMAPAVVLSPLGTTLADRFPRDRVLVWSCVVRAAAAVGGYMLGGVDETEASERSVLDQAVSKLAGP
jgi:nitrate/nitrite transporter NarK